MYKSASDARCFDVGTDTVGYKQKSSGVTVLHAFCRANKTHFHFSARLKMEKEKKPKHIAMLKKKRQYLGLNELFLNTML